LTENSPTAGTMQLMPPELLKCWEIETGNVTKISLLYMPYSSSLTTTV